MKASAALVTPRVPQNCGKTFDKNTSKEEGFALALGFQGPWLAGSISLCLRQDQNLMEAGACGSVAKEPREEKQEVTGDHTPFLDMPPVSSTS